MTFALQVILNGTTMWISNDPSECLTDVRANIRTYEDASKVKTAQRRLNDEYGNRFSFEVVPSPVLNGATP